MGCINQKWQKGARTYGDDIPSYAQGAYFPGDEPGYVCKLSGYHCGNINGRNPEECWGQTFTDTDCPYCKDEGQNCKMIKDGRGTVFCPNCGQWLEDLI